jgi:hypothetical protein
MADLQTTLGSRLDSHEPFLKFSSLPGESNSSNPPQESKAERDKGKADNPVNHLKLPRATSSGAQMDGSLNSGCLKMPPISDSQN